MRIFRILFLASFIFGCAHHLHVESTPDQAMVYSIGANGKRSALLGRTPLDLDGISAGSTAAIEVEQSGFVPERIAIPTGLPSEIKVKANLIPLSEQWMQSLPAELYAKILERSITDHIRLQESLFSKTDAEFEVQTKIMSQKYGRLAVFHYLLGHFHYAKERYKEASEEFTKALEINPTSEDTRRMLTLVDAKIVENSQSERARAMSAFGAAAGDIAALSGGTSTGKVISKPSESRRSFEIVLPADTLFRKGTAIPSREAVLVAQKLTDEFHRIRQPLKILVECHTDSNLGELADSNNGIVSKGKIFGSLLELSSARASAFLATLESEGAEFSSSAIAGYGNTVPFLPETDDKGVIIPKNQTANRRIVLKIVYETNEKTSDNKADAFLPERGKVDTKKLKAESVGPVAPAPVKNLEKASHIPPASQKLKDAPNPRAPKVQLPDIHTTPNPQK